MPLRVVFDTNTVLSALVFGKGRLAWLRQVWCEWEIVPLISQITEEELVRVLAYPKFKLSQAEQEVLLAEYLPFCEKVAIPEPPPVVPECRDTKDTPFLWLAMAANADCLVTGDKDLLALVDQFPIPILTPDVFKEQITA